MTITVTANEFAGANDFFNVNVKVNKGIIHSSGASSVVHLVQVVDFIVVVTPPSVLLLVVTVFVMVPAASSSPAPRCRRSSRVEQPQVDQHLQRCAPAALNGKRRGG
eukprot:COSAG06_NODE_3258_length_5606_cov_3.545488_3_plen_107_part_00